MKVICLFFMAALVMAITVTAAAQSPFTVTSKQITEGGHLTQEQVYKGFGCDGQNTSPSLQWSHPPEGTKSFAITVYDPDAPTGSGWWHWVVFDIPADVRSIDVGASGTLAQGIIESVTDFGAPGFGGACPPEGDKAHRYIFTVYALKVEKLGLDATAMPALVGFMRNAEVLGSATITTVFNR